MDGAAVSAAAWGVWCALSTFAKWETERGQPVRSKENSCFPTLAAIAIRSHNKSESTVKAAIKELVSAGYVRVSARYGRKSKGAKGEQRSNGYTLYPAGNAPALPISEEDRAALAAKMKADVARLFPDLSNTKPE